VCKYDFEDLILLGAIRISDGVEIDIHSDDFKNLAGFKLVKKYDSTADFQTLKESIDPNAEGYVIRFKKGLERFSRRMKIKGEEYCRLHSIITKISSRDVWEFLKDEKPMDELLEHVPDEFDAWVRKQIEILTKSYQLIDLRLRDRYDSVLNTDDVTCKKDFALKVLKEPKENRGIYFNMYDGRDYRPLIWNKIYPKYSKPFTLNDTEGDDN
jgi:RNA ligase